MKFTAALLLLLFVLLPSIAECAPLEIPGHDTYYAYGHKYVGQTQGSDAHGQGECTLQDGALFSGHWEHERLFQGRVTRQDGFQYDFDGEFFRLFRPLKEGVVVGLGVARLDNGDTFTGYIDKKGQFIGRGSILRSDGTREYGLWKDGLLVKEIDPLSEKERILLFDTELETLSNGRIAELDTLLEDATIPAIQSYFEAGRLTSEELVLYYIHRIRQHDLRLNSVLELNPDVLTIARQRDTERSATKPRSGMHGIPILLKDNVGTGDKLHTTAGAKALVDAHCDRDAFIVSQLRESGAIILGKCNMSEWANMLTHPLPTGFSGMGGQTRNPFGDFISGGSSSGSAVAVAARFATVSVGTETAGSLTSPASQNSLYTIKPSMGLISRDRIIPISESMDTAGPMARSVTDLSILLNELAGVDPQDPVTNQAASLAEVDFTQHLVDGGLQGKRIGIANTGFYKEEDGRQLLEKVASFLRSEGADVSIINLPTPKPNIVLIELFRFSLRRGVNQYLSDIGDHAPFANIGEIVAFNKEDSVDRIPFGQSALEASHKVKTTPEEYDKMMSKAKSDATAYIRGIMRERQIDFLLTFRSRFSATYSAAGFPALTIPVGFSAAGEPVGLTLVGDYLTDPDLISAAYAFEQNYQLEKPRILK